MEGEHPQHRPPYSRAALFLWRAGVLLVMILSPAAGQDIRGMEICTAEKQMDRRTACLQANVEFLQKALIKLDRETRDSIVSANREISDARAEIATLKSTIEKLNRELTQMNAEPSRQKLNSK
jgi:septal ring factor EnvC (AmiA/AmiB activator)